MYNSAGELVDHAADGQALYQQPTGLGSLQAGFVPDAGGEGRVVVLGPQVALGWNGADSAGQWVASGTYTLVLTSRDPFGQVTTFTCQVTVIREPADVQVEIYNSAGELVRHFSGQADDPRSGAQLSVSSQSFAASGLPGQGLVIQYGSASGDTVTWDGRNDQGDLAQSGTYTVKVLRQLPGSSPTVLTDTVTLLDVSGDPLAGALAAPDPALAGQGRVEILLGAPAAQGVRAAVYDQAGEKVADLEAAAGSRGLTWDISGRRMAEGVYLIVLSTRDARGRVARKVLKEALLR